MFFRFILTVVSLMTCLHNNHVSSCEENCTGKPVFTPSRLVVKYGHSTSATCVACQGDCHDKTFGLERSVGKVTENGTTLFWTVGKLTEWDPSPKCYYYNPDSGDQCCTELPVIVYQPPENVSISFVNHTGPMSEHSQHTLQCIVENVAPVGSLVVTFYRGQTELSQEQHIREQYKPVTETFILEVNINRKDHRAQYWCEAKLELGPEGPQPPPVVKSEIITATVHWSDLNPPRVQPATTMTPKTASKQKNGSDLNPPRVQPATTTTPKTASKQRNSATTILFHKFIMCLMLLFSTLV